MEILAVLAGKMDDKGMKRVWLRGCGVVLVAGVLGCGFAAAQSTEADVASRLKDKPLYLKGFWGDNKLEFDTDGKPSKTYRVVSFTLAGFDFRSAKVKGDKLRLEGSRIGLTFDEQGRPHRESLEQRIQIEVDGHGNVDFTKALDNIFADGLAELTPALPSYWKAFAEMIFVQGKTLPDRVEMFKLPKTLPASNEAMHIGGSVKPPRLVSSVDPSYTPTARAKKFSGRVQVYLWVAEDGVPSHLRIVRPAGLGLDEQALAAVQQYRFKPATQNDKPVKVDLYIDVNFQIF